MHKEAIRRHCAELNRCNQRGGRMLSVFDLLDAGTLDIDLAAYLMARITRGDSLMVGANPGGAGKTTVMCALLNLAPPQRPLVAATGPVVSAAARAAESPPRCFVCHEIGAGRYFSYLWGEDLRAYCSLRQQGHMLATNLHADDLDEAREQVCVENGVSEAHFNAFHLLVFLRVGGGFARRRRRIDEVYASDGASAHACVYDARHGLRKSPDDGVDDASLTRCRAFLERGQADGLWTIEEVRERVVEFFEKGAG